MKSFLKVILGALLVPALTVPSAFAQGNPVKVVQEVLAKIAADPRVRDVRGVQLPA